MHVTLFDVSPKNHIEKFFGRTSMKKKHDTVCIAIFLLVQKKSTILLNCIIVQCHVF